MSEERIPRLSKHLKIRKREPVAYDGKRRMIFELNETAIAILRSIDGEQNIRDIASDLADLDTTTVSSFLDDCVAAGLVEWAAGEASRYRVPTLGDGFRLRKNEPVGYSGKQSAIFKLNPTAYEILKRVDGVADELEIAIRCTNETEGPAFLATCRRFLDRCAQEGMVQWRSA